MADVTKYYVMKGDKTLAEGLTKEETLAAIIQAVEEHEIGDVDTGFVTTLKEMNSGAGFKFWLGTEAQYQALAEHEKNVLYLISDDTTAEDLEEYLENIAADVANLTADVANLTAEQEKYGVTLWKHSGTPATLNGDSSYIDLDGFFYETKTGILIVCGTISSGIIQVQASTLIPKAIMRGYGMQYAKVSDGTTSLYCHLNHDEEHGTRIYGDDNNTSSTYGILAVIGY